MRVHRNKLDATYCTVTFLMNYLEVAGITEGPIFQKMRKAEVEGLDFDAQERPQTRKIQVLQHTSPSTTQSPLPTCESLRLLTNCLCKSSNATGMECLNNIYYICNALMD